MANKITEKDIKALMAHMFGAQKLVVIHKDGSVGVYNPVTPTKKAIKETIPEAGHDRFYVLCDRLSIYTAIGADNLHHASNKATKLFGPNWSKIKPNNPSDLSLFQQGYTSVSVAKFNELLKTLAI